MRSRRLHWQSGRRGLTATALALLALIGQLLIPAASLAHEANAPAQTVVLCTLDGAKTVSIPAGQDQHHGFGGLKCHDCVMTSVAALTASDGIVILVLYVVESQLEPEGFARPQARSRAPPRPPSTAPPLFQTA